MHSHRIAIVVAATLLLPGCRTGKPLPPTPAAEPEPSWTFARCFAEPPDSAVTEIRIERSGGCLGFRTTSTTTVPGPIFHTGPCAGYRMTLRSDGSAEYEGVEHVPMLGKRTGRIDRKFFQRLGRLAEEIGFASWEDDYPAQQRKSAQWVCVSLDGEGPVFVTVVSPSGSKTIRHEQDVGAGPAWLAVFEREIEDAAVFIEWH